MRFVTRLTGIAVLVAGCQKPSWNGDPPWKSTPISVTWNDLGTDFDSSFTNAIGAWNFAAGCGVLTRAHDASAANVVMSWYDGTICGHPGSIEDTPGATAGTSRCSSDHAEVRFRTLTSMYDAFVVSSHELGHVLGLAHDRSALMQQSPPLYQPEIFGGAVPALPLPSDTDGSAIGDRYCRKASR